MKFDLHNHTEYSFDSKKSMEELIKEALYHNIDVLGFSDHLDFAPGDSSAYYYKPDKQLIEFNKLKNKYKNDIILLLGIEASYEKYYYDKIKNILNNYPFDYTIMSVHFVDKIVISKWIKSIEKNAKSIEDVDYSHYFEQMLELVKYGDFDILGHIDYYKKYSKFNHENTFKKYKDYYNKIFEILIKRNKIIEINSSGLRYEINEAFPSMEILEFYKEKDGKIVSIGSDSHHENQCAFGFDKMYNMIEHLNFKLYNPINIIRR